VESELDRLRKKVENFPSASLYNRLAELARNAGSVDEAEAVCRKCMKEFPRNGQAYVIVAEIEMARGAKAKALELGQMAIERDPRNVGGYVLLADLAAADKDGPKALGYLKQALAIKPNDAGITAKIGEVEKATGAKAPSTAAVAASMPAAAARPAPVAGGEPLVPFQGPMTTAVKAATSSRTATLDALCGEAGVRGALVADMHGRVVVAKNISGGQDELLAALASEVAKSAVACQNVLGSDKLTTWALTGGAGQVLAFQRDKAFSVVVVADPTVRPAMLELRARQTLIDLGAA
jgi:predicted regulator of Ras-like GTPase activity (Roadblock/LC7/MglB family)